MKLIVDTNILYSYFWKDSITKKMLISQDFELCSPEFALEEINKYKNDIMKKNNLSLKEFEKTRLDIAIAVKFIPLKEYSALLKPALKICPDKNDVDFFALALKMKLPLWSNDVRLKNQTVVAVISTKELISIPLHGKDL